MALGVLTVTAWACLLVYNASVLMDLAHFRDVAIEEDMPFILVPLAGLIVSVWVGLLSTTRLPVLGAFKETTIVLFELALLVLGCFFILVVMASRSG